MAMLWAAHRVGGKGGLEREVRQADSSFVAAGQDGEHAGKAGVGCRGRRLEEGQKVGSEGHAGNSS